MTSPIRTDRAAEPAEPAKPDPTGPGDPGDAERPLTARRMVLRWVALAVFVAILATVFVNLGQWQLRRLEERRTNNAATVRAEETTVVPFTAFFTRPISSADQWHRVQVTGTFDADHQYVVRYRSNADATGYEIVTPLRADDGTTILVDRGFVALPGGQQIPTAAPPPPSGTVTVVGHVRRNETGRSGAIVPAQNQVRLINAPAIAATLPYPLVDGYIGLLSVEPAQQGDFVAVQPPELSDGPHFWYAVQWFMFTSIGVLGLVVFIRSDLRDRRQARQTG